jgi:serine/threonine protein kinase
MHREAIEREISIMQTLDHPKIIKLYQAFIDEDEINLLLEYAGGGSVHD